MSVLSLPPHSVQGKPFVAAVIMPTRLPKVHQSPADSLVMQNQREEAAAEIKLERGSNPKSVIDLPESMREMK